MYECNVVASNKVIPTLSEKIFIELCLLLYLDLRVCHIKYNEKFGEVLLKYWVDPP